MPQLVRSDAERERVQAPLFDVGEFWESVEAREHYQSQPEHGEALRESGLLDAITDSRSRVFEDAELTSLQHGERGEPALAAAILARFWMPLCAAV